MLKQIFHKAIILFICYALAFSPAINAAQAPFLSADILAPKLSQPNYINTVIEGNDHSVTVNVVDNVAIKQVILYYRVIGAENFNSLQMNNINGTDEYQVTIAAKEIKDTGIEYYIQAIDSSDNVLFHGHSFSPLSVALITNTINETPAFDDTEKITEEGMEEVAQLQVPEKSSIFTNKWFWIGVGVLVLGAAAGGGGGGSGPAATTTSLTIGAGELVIP